MSRSLTPAVLASVLRDLAANRKEGVLRVRLDDVQKSIFLRDGHIVRVDSDASGESLAETVERMGKAKRVDLELATTVMKQTGESLVKTLAEMGLIAPGDVAAIERERAQSIFRSLFAQTGGAFQFDERALAMGADEEPLRLSVDEVVPNVAVAPQPSGGPSPRPASAAKAVPRRRPKPQPQQPRASVEPRNVRPAEIAGKRTRGGGARLLLAAAVLGVAVVGSILFIRGRANEQDAPTRSAAAAGGLETAAAAVADRVSEGPTDAERFTEAALAFAANDLEASKATLEALLERSPDFAEAQELLERVEERLANPTPEPAPRPSARAAASSSAPEPEPEPEPEESAPSANSTPTSSSAQNLREARLAYERGELAASRQALEALLSADPSHGGAQQLLVAVDDAIWHGRLPLAFEAAHNHRLGGCNGTLSLEPWGIGFTSDDHGWQWGFDDMLSLERDSRWILNLETRESDRLSLGGGKNYKFQFTNPIPDDDWSRFQRLARR